MSEEERALIDDTMIKNPALAMQMEMNAYYNDRINKLFDRVAELEIRLYDVENPTND